MHTSILLYAAAVLSAPLNKRDNTCSFPTNQGLVAVTKDQSNAGWAMSPDQKCTGGSYCPYACPPGKLMAQWDPSATTYTSGTSMNGGIYCNADGSISKPMPNKDYCVDGEGTLNVNNKANDNVAFCQTVLPGNEAMLIPTNVDGNGHSDLAVPGPDYYAGTAAHYYINAPGVSATDGCVWGTSDKPQGNWSPYVAGANTDDSGNTFIKIGWNPKYIEDFNNQKPSFGIRITCDDPNQCNGLDCEIDPSKTGFNGISSNSQQSLGASYCIVTATNKAKATIEVFSV